MNRQELMAKLAGASDEDLKDVLLRAAVEAWLIEGSSVDDIQYLVEEIAKE